MALPERTPLNYSHRSAIKHLKIFRTRSFSSVCSNMRPSPSDDMSPFGGILGQVWDSWECHINQGGLKESLDGGMEGAILIASPQNVYIKTAIMVACSKICLSRVRVVNSTREVSKDPQKWFYIWTMSTPSTQTNRMKSATHLDAWQKTQNVAQ